MKRLKCIAAALIFPLLVASLMAGSSPAQAQSNAESSDLAYFAALMQYIRSQPTPADVKSANIPVLGTLDTALSDIYITGFITPYTGETPEQVKARLQSVPEEDRFTAVMVESYRLASNPLLLNIIHELLPLYYVEYFTTAEDLNTSSEFLKRAEIATLAAAFDSTDYAIPAPSTTGAASPSAQRQDSVDSDYLAKFAAIMQYIRSQPTPADVKSANIPVLSTLDTALSDIYVTGFITPYTGETPEQVKARLQSVPEEKDRFTAVMVESYRLASNPLLLNIIHQLLPLYYVEYFTTAEDLNASAEFLKRAEIATLADAFDPTDYAISMPAATSTILPQTTGTRYFDDPDVPYLSWEVGANIPDSMFYDNRQGILLVERYVRSLDVPELDNEVVFYLYWDIVPAIARVTGRSEQELRQRDRSGEVFLADDGSGAIFINGLIKEKDGVPPLRFTHIAAHELIHIYQYSLAAHRGFDLDHSKVRVHGPAWLHEGGAEFQTHRALTKGAVYFYDERRRRSSQTASAVDTPLSDLETPKAVLATQGSYQLGEMAVELLATRAGEEAVMAYWTLLDSQTPWEEAFETTFGTTISEFYLLFEQRRAAGFPEVDLPSIGPSIEDLPQVDRPALMALYDATGGANWTNSSNWNSDTHISQWHGVTINPAGRVAELRLTRNRLRGKLPPELGSLTELRVLGLWANELTGSMPRELADLTRLEALALGGNRLSGEIPSWIGGLGNLRELHLRFNRFTGPIPPWIGDLPLRRLYLTDNQLSGDVPAELGNLSDLRALWLGGNKLTGCIPDELRDVPDNDFADTGLPFCGEPDDSLSLSVETELAGYWSSGEGGVDVTLTLMDAEPPWREGVHTISIVCRQNGEIVEGCGQDLSVSLPDGGGVATSSAMLRTPMGGVSFEFNYGGVEPVTAQFHVPERILSVERDVWECYRDEPDRLEPDTAETPISELGYYGDCAGWGSWAGFKWDQDIPVRVWATGLESYIAVLRDTLRELSPLLNLDFTWVDSGDDAAFRAYVGIPSSEVTSYGFPEHCAESVGCGGPRNITREGVVESAWLSLHHHEHEWMEEAGVIDEYLKFVMIHEALHALVPMNHREDPASIMNNRNALPLPTLSPMDEALIRLHQHRLVEVGMTPDEIVPLMVFREDLLDSLPPREPDGYELARNAFAALQEAKSAKFRITGEWSGPNCDVSFGWADLEVTEFASTYANVTRFKQDSRHYYVIAPTMGDQWEFWIEDDGEWTEVGQDRIYDETPWRMDFSSLHMLLVSALYFSDADQIEVSRDTDGLITLNVTLDDAYIVLPWTGGETLEVELTLEEGTLNILEYDFRWTFDVPSGSPCTSYTTKAVDGEYGIEVEIPDTILEGSANISASNSNLHIDPFNVASPPVQPPN